jgi:hypothetical protein
MKDDPSVEMHHGEGGAWIFLEFTFNPSMVPCILSQEDSRFWYSLPSVSSGQTIIVRPQAPQRPHLLQVHIIDVKTSEDDNETASIPLGFRCQRKELIISIAKNLSNLP